MSTTETPIPVTAYVRESYAREKHPDNPAIIEARRQGFDQWLAARDAEVRAEVIEQLRWLAKARAEYDHIPEGGYHSATESERLVHHEHSAAAGLADILEGTSDGMGWLPSWKWDEWDAIRTR